MPPPPAPAHVDNFLSFLLAPCFSFSLSAGAAETPADLREGRVRRRCVAFRNRESVSGHAGLQIFRLWLHYFIRAGFSDQGTPDSNISNTIISETKPKAIFGLPVVLYNSVSLMELNTNDGSS